MENIKQLVCLMGKINCFFFSILQVIDSPSIPKYNHMLLEIGINLFSLKPMIQFECISPLFRSVSCICFSTQEPVNKMIEYILQLYFFSLFFHLLCLSKHLTVMTLQCDEWRGGSPSLSESCFIWKPFITHWYKTQEQSLLNVSWRRNCRRSDQRSF